MSAEVLVWAGGETAFGEFVAITRGGEVEGDADDEKGDEGCDAPLLLGEDKVEAQEEEEDGEDVGAGG